MKRETSIPCPLDSSSESPVRPPTRSPRFGLSELSASLFAVCGFLSLLSPAVDAHRFEWYDGSWAHDESVLTPNPQLKFGRLSNGLRWILYPTDQNPDHLSLRLNVQAGTQMEGPDEIGASHLLNALVPQGSLRSTAEEMRFFLESYGMNLERDLGRHTDEMASVYRLNLPNDRPSDLNNGLQVLRNIADRLRINETEVSRQHQTVLDMIGSSTRPGLVQPSAQSEPLTTGDIARDWCSFLYEGTRLTDSVYSHPEKVLKLKSETLRDFYTTWYNPSRMVVVIVGNIDSKLADTLVKKHFGSMKPKPLVYPDDTGTLNTDGVKAFVRHLDVSATEVSVNIVASMWSPVATLKRDRYRTIEQLLISAIRRRLNRMTEENPHRWSYATFESNRFDPPQPVVTFRARTAGSEWKPALKELEAVFKSLRTYGLTEEEFREVVAEREIFLKSAVEAEVWRSNDDLADQLVRQVNVNRISFSPQQNLERYREVIRTLTLKEFNHSLFAVLTIPNRRLKVVGAAQTTPAEVLAYWKTLEQSVPAAPAHFRQMAFPYLEEPPVVPALNLQQKQLPGQHHELYVWTGTLDNGIKVYLQPLPFEADHVNVSFVYGDGLYGVRDSESIIPRLAVGALRQNGVGRLSRAEAERLFKARGLSVREAMTCFHNLILGDAHSRDLETLLQAVWTQFKDPFLSDKNLALTLERIAANESERTGTIEALADLERFRYFSGSDQRSKPVVADEVSQIPIETLRRYVAESHRRGSPILQISGDFELGKAADIATKLFGSLPPAESPAKKLGQKPVFPQKARHMIRVSGDHSGNGVLMIGWHANLNSAEREQATARTMTAMVVRNRLRKALADSFPARLRPSVIYRHQTEHDGYGYLLLEVKAKDHELPKVETLLRRVMTDLEKNGVTDDEVDLVRAPMNARWRSKRATNLLWSRLVLNTVSLDKPYLVWFEQTGRHIAELGARDINRELRKMLKGRSSTLVIKGE